MTKYLIDAEVTVQIVDVTVTVDDAAPGLHRDKLAGALRTLLNDRLVLLDLKGSRGGLEGRIDETTKIDVTNWDGQ